MDEENGVSFGAGLVIGILIAFTITFLCCGYEWKKQGIRHNAAEWKLDDKTGESSWHWKDETTQSTEKK